MHSFIHILNSEFEVNFNSFIFNRLCSFIIKSVLVIANLLEKYLQYFLFGTQVTIRNVMQYNVM